MHALNEVTGVGENTLTYDKNGNMTTDEMGKKFVYDAWNRLVEFSETVEETTTVLKSYSYDGMNRRITETVGEVTTQLVYSIQWQVLEEIVDGHVTARNVWSPIYVDAMILRDRDTDNDEFHTLDERLWVQQDANFNVTALIGKVEGVRTVVERYMYDTYGAVTVLNADFTLKDGGTAYAWQYYHQGARIDLVTGNSCPCTCTYACADT